MMKLTLIFSILILFVSNVHGQSRTIEGTVINEELELIPYVIICSSDTVKIGEANINGQFSISVKEDTDQLIFRFIGMELLTIKFLDDSNNFELIMMTDGIYDFISSRKVDKLRKKKFNKLTEIRKEAFKKGIFKSDTMNFSQEFVNYRDN